MDAILLHIKNCIDAHQESGGVIQENFQSDLVNALHAAFTYGLKARAGSPRHASGRASPSSSRALRRDYFAYVRRCARDALRRPTASADAVRYVRRCVIPPGGAEACDRSRALITYCVMHHCVTDVFNECISNSRVTNDFYEKDAVFHDASLKTILAQIDAFETYVAPDNLRGAMRSPSTSSLASTSCSSDEDNVSETESVPPAQDQVSKLLERIAILEDRLAKSDALESEWHEKETSLLAHISNLEVKVSDLLRTSSENVKGELIETLRTENDDLSRTIDFMEKERSKLLSRNQFLLQKFEETQAALNDTEATLCITRRSEYALKTRQEKLEQVNESLKSLVEAVRKESSILKKQVSVMEREINNTHALLEHKKQQIKTLEDQAIRTRARCVETASLAVTKENEVKHLMSLLEKLGEKVSLIDERNSSSCDSTVESQSLSNADNDECSRSAVLPSDNTSSLIKTLLEQYSSNSVSNTTQAKADLFEQCCRYLGNALLQHELVIDHSNSKLSTVIANIHSTNRQLHVTHELFDVKQLDSVEPLQDEEGNSSGSDAFTLTDPPKVNGCDFLGVIFDSVKRNFEKLHGLLQHNERLHVEFEKFRNLNEALVAKMQEQERKLCGVTQELDKAKTLLVDLDKSHKQLQSTKAIMRYELSEKKSLLRHLRDQLESTREEWKRVHRSNAESEVEWQSLREEFHSRHKQDSLDSGCQDEQSSREPTPADGELSTESTPEDSPDPSDEIQVLPIELEDRYRARTQRLEFLERQCQVLYSSLIRSSERTTSLQRRLNTMLDSRESSSEVSPASTSVEDEVLLDADSPDGVADEADDVPTRTSLPEFRKRTLGAIVAKLKLDRKEKEDVIVELKNRLAEAEKMREQLSQQVVSLNEEKRQREEEMRHRASGMLRTERALKDVQLNDLTRERDCLLTRIQELQEQLSKRDAELSEISGQHQQAVSEQNELRKKLETMKEQYETLRVTHQHFANNFESQEETISCMRERMTRQEAFIVNLEQALAFLKEERSKENLRLRLQLDEVKLLLALREEECHSLSDQLKRQRVSFDGEVSQLRADVQSSFHLARTFEEQLHEQRSDSAELKRKIVRLLKEKEALWRQNDSLQRQQVVHATERWMSNKDHHCRLCGRIYCHNCSDNWLQIAASRKPARVCDDCHKRQAALERAAGLPCSDSPSTSGSRILTSGPLCLDDDDDDASDDDDGTDGQQRLATNSFAEKSCRSCETAVSAHTYSVMHNRSSCATPEMPIPTTSAYRSSHCDFDIISDEEIARSLSGCSPYNESVSSPRTGCSGALDLVNSPMSLFRTVDDLRAAGDTGIDGEIWVSAGSCYGLRFYLTVPGMVLRWKFTSEPKSICFEVKYHAVAELRNRGMRCAESASATKASPGNQNSPVASVMGGATFGRSCQIVLPSARVEAHLNPAEGSVVVSDPGVYVLLFDNQYSKFTAKKIMYNVSGEFSDAVADDSEVSPPETTAPVRSEMAAASPPLAGSSSEEGNQDLHQEPEPIFEPELLLD